MTYGWRGALGFFVCAYPVASALEALAIGTGFPFGFRTHDGPGPEILGVRPPRCRSGRGSSWGDAYREEKYKPRVGRRVASFHAACNCGELPLENIGSSF